ncbi:MAG: hypothetical protein AAGB31_01050 [Bdellovibrio sp.]
MKKWVVLGLLFSAYTAQASNASLVVNCRPTSSGTFFNKTIEALDGDITAVPCDKLSCPQDHATKEVTLKYNAYQKNVILTVNDSVASTSADVTFENIQEGSHINYSTANSKQQTFFVVSCEVQEVR